MTYSSPSRTAVVDTWDESEPKLGSVIAIEAHSLPNRSSCSSLATDAIAASPRPWRGIDSTIATSPQQASMIDSTEDMLVPLRFPGPSFPESRRTPRAPVPPSPPSFIPSIRAASMSSSFIDSPWGASMASYLREIGRKISVDTWWAWLTSIANFFGTSRLIAISSWPPSAPRRDWPHAFRSPTAGARCGARSCQHHPFHHTGRSQIAVPPLDRVLLDVAVPTEQLDAVAADLHAVLGGEPTGEGDLARERTALFGPRR